MCFFSLLGWNSHAWANLILALAWALTPADELAQTCTNTHVRSVWNLCHTPFKERSEPARVVTYICEVVLGRQEGSWGRKRSKARVAGGVGGQNFSSLGRAVQELAVLRGMNRLSTGRTVWGHRMGTAGVTGQDWNPSAEVSCALIATTFFFFFFPLFCFLE